jgi:hypothetical protein
MDEKTLCWDFQIISYFLNITHIVLSPQEFKEMRDDKQFSVINKYCGNP